MPLKFENAASVESICWSLRQSEFQRSRNRALVDGLFNGCPPYDEKEAQENSISTNVNDLSATVINGSARRQIWNAMQSPDPFVAVSLDSGPPFKRNEWASVITRLLNKPLKGSAQFMELRDGVGAQVVLHGIAPTQWQDQDKWLQVSLGIEDVLIPSNTLRDFTNMPYVAIYRQYSANQLFDLTQGPNVDPGWNMPLVQQCLTWLDQQANQLLGSNWPAMWMPEKVGERWKSDSGCYANAVVPTIDCFDFFYYCDDDKDSGWKRRIILDAWGMPGADGIMPDPSARRIKHGKGSFLYDSGDRIYADKLTKFLHFQFGDASAVAPFRYHSVRSMGFLLYAVCHLQNRLKCKLSDAAFENLLQYFRTNNPADADRLQKVDLVNLGFVPDGLQFVRAEERWKPDTTIAQMNLEMYRQSMADVSTAFSQNTDQSSPEETATLTMARVNSTAALVGSMLNRIYAYEKFRFQEIARRFCKANSKDPDVREFRLGCLKEGVPEEMLDVNRWNIKVSEVLGAGDKMVQMAIVDRLMATRPLHGPEAQAKILKLHDATVTDNWALAEELNPPQPHVSDTIHDTEIVIQTLLISTLKPDGNPSVTPKPGLNNMEVIETCLKGMAVKIAQIKTSGGVGTPQDVAGFANANVYVTDFIGLLEQDPEMAEKCRQYSDFLGKAMNEVKAFAQRQQEQAQAAQEQTQQDPKAQAQVQAIQLQAETKAKLAAQSHAEKVAQKRISFDQKIQQDKVKSQLQIAADLQRHQAELAKTGLEARHAQELHQAKKEAEPVGPAE